MLWPRLKACFVVSCRHVHLLALSSGSIFRLPGLLCIESFSLQIFPPLFTAQEDITHFVIRNFPPSPPRRETLLLLNLVANRNDLKSYQPATFMQDKLEIHILPAQQCHVDAMVHIFTNSFDLDESVKFMYTKDEIGPMIQAMLHSHMDYDSMKFKIAVTQDSGLIVGWMSFGIVIIPPGENSVPQLTFSEWTSLATQRLLLLQDYHVADSDNPRFLLATELLNQSHQGQRKHILSNRLVINTIVTDPAYRRRGVAGQLLKTALEHARSSGLDPTPSLWAQTPTVYQGLFWQHGFFGVGAFGINLDQFKTPEEAATETPGSQLGLRTWTQMKLEFKATPSKKKKVAETVVAGSSKSAHGQTPGLKAA